MQNFSKKAVGNRGVAQGQVFDAHTVRRGSHEPAIFGREANRCADLADRRPLPLHAYSERCRSRIEVTGPATFKALRLVLTCRPSLARRRERTLESCSQSTMIRQAVAVLLLAALASAVHVTVPPHQDEVHCVSRRRIQAAAASWNTAAASCVLARLADAHLAVLFRICRCWQQVDRQLRGPHWGIA